MKVKLIYNPVSGDGTFKNHLDYIIDKFQQQGLQIEPYRTNKREELDQMISLMDEKEYKKVLIAGGDGTLNQVMNSLLKYDIHLPIGIFPVGTANDYAQYFNLPREMEEIVEILLRDNYTLSDVGLVNDRYFINVASLGVLIDISQRTNLELKHNLGVLAYYLHGIAELPKVKPVNIQVHSEDMHYDGEILFMLIMNGRSAGGFHKLAPTASINDGLLDVFIFKKCPIYELGALLLAAISGEHVNNNSVIHFKTQYLSIHTDGDVGTDLDGEGGPAFPLNIRVVPNRLKILTRHHNEDNTILQKNLESTYGRMAFVKDILENKRLT
ncbi:YegS/Rv2252/BmrU family lipid kinase [Anaerosolibacter carboniphilus]|uniref:YegS/Rv2252/BmrU family lipid kinase n=1 Tax=Anaerosolibacter carboniphilus TaxID=1417629 RepID=A0A841KUH9_9FIRM|nr:YegS/Rv2252/BmrU family lipid kinase [Anaerosolibacter carboniphilus]MBB6217364.1 YegS/Rv2252/BmrU family lipid kinase [Anaerosolibacter carboniphilus]